ncbi:MAG: HAD family hydrolase [Ruminococcaceae bacterium]|nr:HAD family hydrolase [Oscillospiraceae bacterium]
MIKNAKDTVNIMKYKFEACMFDLDGTLCNTLDSIAYFANSALTFYGYSPIDTQEYKLLIGNGADMLIRRMLNKVAGEYTEETVKAVRKKYDELYESEPLKLVEPYKGIPELLDKLHSMGIKITVLSNKPDDMTKAVVKGILGDKFDYVQGQKKEFEKKPSPQAPLYIAKEINVSPENILYLGDSGVDMQTAINSGFTACGVSWGFRSVEELKENGADFIAHTALEILDLF